MCALTAGVFTMQTNEYDPREFADVGEIGGDSVPNEGLGIENESLSGATLGQKKSTSIIDGLLETRPDDRPEAFGVEDMGLANIMIGVKKFVNGISGPDRDLGEGTPAIVNLVLGALDLSGLLDRQKSGSKTQQEPESVGEWEGADGIPKEERGI